MAESFPSKAMVIMDIPEVSKVDVTFVYNFFRPDERVNESGTQYDLSGWQPSERSNATVSTARKLLHLGVARYVKIAFSPVVLASTYVESNEKLSPLGSPADRGKLIAPNLENIRNEIEVATRGSAAVIFHDTALQKRLAKFINLSLALRDPEAAKQGSSAEQAKKLNDLTPNSVIGNILFESVYDPTSEGMFFVNHQTGRILRHHADTRDIGGQGSQRLYCQINDRYLGAIFRNSDSNPFGPFTVSISKKTSEMVGIASSAKMNENPSVLSGDEYSVNLQPIEEIEMVPLEEPRMWSNAAVIGYVIDKDEILPDGSREKKDPLILTSSTATAIIDTKVKYGSVYSYEVRAILLYEYEALITGEAEFTLATSFIVIQAINTGISKLRGTLLPHHTRQILIWYGTIRIEIFDFFGVCLLLLQEM